MKFMGDFPLGKSDRTKLAQEIVQEGLDEVLLRDEIYCQLIKQTNNNPKRYASPSELFAFSDTVLTTFVCSLTARCFACSDSMLKGFELMGLCVACFTGSPSFSPYLTQFLAEASDLSSVQRRTQRTHTHTHTLHTIR
jgi:hypothetical protein